VNRGLLLLLYRRLHRLRLLELRRLLRGWRHRTSC
jgi:hypothetical protein